MNVLLVRYKTGEVIGAMFVPFHAWTNMPRRLASGLELLDYPEYRRLLMDLLDIEVSAKHALALACLADISRTELSTSQLLQPLQYQLDTLDLKEHVRLLVQRRWDAVRGQFNIPE